MNEGRRGFLATGAIWFALVIAILFTVCVAVGDDEDSWAPMLVADNEGKQGDCREVDEDGYCEDNDFSPSFQDSPVDRSFNPVICLPMSTCEFHGEQGQEEEEA